MEKENSKKEIKVLKKYETEKSLERLDYLLSPALCEWRKSGNKPIGDKPIRYKKLILYPITIAYFWYFKILENCLTIMKNQSGDLKAIQLSYLDYLFYLSEEKKDSKYVFMLNELLMLVFRKNEYALDESGNMIPKKQKFNGEMDYIKNIEYFKNPNDNNKYNIGVLKENITAWENGIDLNQYDIYDGKDFDEIRKIICEQNDIELLPENIHPDKIDKIREYEKMLSQRKENQICSFEEQKDILKLVKGWDNEQLDKMTIRSFNSELERFGILLNYTISSILSPNMEESSRKKILSWIGQREKISKIDKISVDATQFGDKFSPKTK